MEKSVSKENSDESASPGDTPGSHSAWDGHATTRREFFKSAGGVARSINRVGLYREAAAALGIGLPAETMRTTRLIDGAIWSGLEPEQFAQAAVARAWADPLQSLMEYQS